MKFHTVEGMWIETHAHLTMPPLLEEVAPILDRAQAAGIARIVNICTDGPSLEAGLKLAKARPEFFNAAAATPHDVHTLGDAFFSVVEKHAKQGDLIAVGETGLDYHYEHAPREMQKSHLLRYFALAKETKLPLIFHCREAFDDLFALADAHLGDWPCVLHCFTGSCSEAKQVIERGWYLSISGIATFKRADEIRKAIVETPLERLLIETDSPYLAPQSRRGKQNEPAFLVETGELIAKLKGTSPEEVARVTSANAEQLFVFQK